MDVTTVRAQRRARRYDKERGCYVYDVAFKTVAPLTERTVQVAEAFGLGIDEEQTHILYDDFELHLADGDIVYITGDSGSGKSVLLDAIRRDLGDEAACMNQLTEPGDEPIIDTVGNTFKKALGILSRVGLNDAYLFLRRYHELSEGQRYRYRLAQLLDSGKKHWLCDEFLSTLDRTTAKVVAYNIQKQARRTGATLIAATTHNDLSRDLAPSIHVVKGWGKEIKAKYTRDAAAPRCTVTDDVVVEEASKEDYQRLSYLHYRGGRVTAPLKYYRMTRLGELIAVIVYSSPGVRAGGRKDAVGYTPTLTELNKDWILISRVIVHPKYRGIGLGSRLIAETLPLQGRSHVELIAVMAQYNPFAERAGMTLKKIKEPHPTVTGAMEHLRRLGFKPALMGSLRHNKTTLDSLPRRELVHDALLVIAPGLYLRRLTRLNKMYVTRRELQDWLPEQDNTSLARALKTLSVLAQTKAYLHWSSQRCPK
ncbi:MAG: ABC transporter ATP-binding protein [Candidatus Bathyarchaeota archaeon]|nr:ABC transporter ATP-binding protein [Candidatus Bathyarchaeota archaeon]